MVVYSAQDPGNNPLTSHCFATFARVGPGVKLHDINWFSIRGHRTGTTCGILGRDGRPARPEPGENRTAREALVLAGRLGLRVTRWGPYEIDRRLFEQALRQIELLDGGKVRYKAIDLGLREGRDVRALNCVHAVSDVDREPAPLRTWMSYGDAAVRKVVWHLRRWIKGQRLEHPKVWGAIWAATWQGTPRPPALKIVRGNAPWERERERKGHVAGALARDGAGDQGRKEGGPS
jgi:hypothetical protein